MPAQGQVKLWHQIVFLFIPFAAIWAFYRIEKLSKAVLYISIPSFVINAITATAVESTVETDFGMGILLMIGITAPMTIWAIYLMRKWTLFWNRQFSEKSN